MDITKILLLLFFLPFMVIIVYVVSKVIIQMVLTLYADMLGLIGLNNIRSSIITKWL